jgi:tRNA pseudouridine55 synthase
MDGKVVRTADPSGVDEAALRGAFAAFVGEIQQIPPMVSAVKKDGERLYELARQGIEVEREPKTVFINSIDITKVELPCADFVVDCSKGTYIRTLCSDVGRKLGCGAVLDSLRRIRSGAFDISDAVTVDLMRSWDQAALERHVEDYLHSARQNGRLFGVLNESAVSKEHLDVEGL